MLTEDKILDITEKIVESTKPEKVVLFGSYANGKATEKSDLDILVIVKNSDLPGIKRVRKIYKTLWGITTVPKDILVYTEDEVNDWKKVDMAFITYILKRGKVLYERQ
ncbi:MAG: nucleotidyltransferase domain-containing protein [Leptospiraceae bacterium]|nr:nucleotidyltransferase domain-containing protein [Leptospiraceae bacterium]